MARFGTRATLPHRRKQIASWTAMAVFAGALTAYALNQHGYPVHHAELNDGGVWVTNPKIGLGRENRPLRQLDATVPVCAASDCNPAQYDVLQNGDAVFQVTSTLTPINTVTGATDTHSVTLNGPVSLGGTTIATLDKSGGLRVGSVQPDSGASDLSALQTTIKAVAQAPKGQLVVGTDGAVYAASGDSLITVPSVNGRPGSPQKSTLGTAALAATGQPGQATAVGNQFVYATGPTAYSVSGHTVDVGGTGSVLQQASDSADSVLVGTSAGLSQINFGSDKPTPVAQINGKPSQPIRLGNCAIGAWYAPGDGTVGMVASQCGGGAVETMPVPGSDVGDCAEGRSPLVLRVNRNSVVLNNVCNGDVWTIGEGKVDKITDWPKTKAPTQKDDSNTTVATQQPKPTATPDELGIRSGSQTTLHVLDNDNAAKDALLQITNLSTMRPAPGLTVAVAPDRQTILASAVDGATSGGFDYSIDDGKGGTDTAHVTLTVRGAEAPAPPTGINGRPDGEVPDYSVADGGTVLIPVTDAWRDNRNGDQISLVATATAGAGKSPEGMLAFTPTDTTPGGPVVVQYTVGTSESATRPGHVTVNVIKKPAAAVAPTANPDVVAGLMVGGNQSVLTVHPLANDVPGADPDDPNAPLTLLPNLSSSAGAPRATVDPSSGTIQIHVDRPGNDFTYGYSVRSGSSNPASGTIRVIITPADSATPSTVPDSATLYGTQPKTVDVLANDFDPLGRVMVVQSATTATPGIQVGVIDNHWLRITETDATKVGTRAAVTYSMSVGAGTSVSGAVNLQIDQPKKDDSIPDAVDDHVVVRSGDTVVVPVLDNDTVPSGAALALLPGLADPSGCPDAAGGITVNSNDPCPRGIATLPGNLIRYRAPAGLTSPITVQIPYTAYNQSVPSAKDSARLFVQVTPVPKSASADQAPTPVAVETRAIQGDTITIKLASTGMDPDGDSVSLTAIGDPASSSPASTVPQKGRILSSNGNAIRYQPFPDASGTDTFSYVVTDTYGQSAAGTIQVGIVPPDAAQDPTPVDDLVTLDPSRTLSINVTSNDIKQAGTTLTIAPLDGSIPGVSADLAAGVITVSGKDHADGTALPVPYRLMGPLGPTDAVGALQVSFKKGYDNPPTAGTAVPEPNAGAATVKVDLSSHIGDIDDASGLKIDQVQSPVAGDAVAPDGTSVTLPVHKHPTVWTFRVTDPAGRSALGTIYVPASTPAGPHLVAGDEIHLKPRQTYTVDLAKHVSDSSGKKVILTDADSVSGTANVLHGTEVTSPTTINITAGSSAGVGVLSFEATDASTASGSEGVRAMISIPVFVGDPGAVFHCPNDAVRVYDQGDPVSVNVAQLCHVWTADPAQANKLTYQTSGASTGIKPSPGSPSISVEAAGAIKTSCTPDPGPQAGQLTVSSGGGSGKIHLAVLCQRPPTFLTPKPFSTTTKAGAIRVDLTANINSTLKADHQHKSVLEVNPLNGAPADLKFDANSAVGTFTPTLHGRWRYQVRVTDADQSRAVWGEIEVDVADVPDPPVAVTWLKRSSSDLLSKSIFISFKDGASDGDDPRGVDHYEVSVSGVGAPIVCQASPCQVTGVPNGDHTLSVRAVNSVGASRPSATIPAYAGTIAGGVRNITLTKVGDGSLKFTWDQPACVDNGSCGSVTSYVLTSGSQTSDAGTARTGTIGHLANGPDAQVKIVANTTSSDAFKKYGITFAVTTGATTSGAPAGKPKGLSLDTPKPLTSADSTATSSKYRLSWTVGDVNGPSDDLDYQLYDGTAPVAGCAYADLRNTPTCDVTIPSNGNSHTYTVTARNLAAAKETTPAGDPNAFQSDKSNSQQATGITKPVKVSNVQVTSNDSGPGEVDFTLHMGPSNGQTSELRCNVGSASGTPCGSWPKQKTSPHNVIYTTSGAPKGPGQTLVFTVWNGKYLSDTVSSAPVDIYASDVQATITASDAPVGSQTVGWSMTIDPKGKPVNWHVFQGGTEIANGQTHADGSPTSLDNQPYPGSWNGTYTFTLKWDDTSASTPNARVQGQPPTATAHVGAQPPPPSRQYSVSDSIARGVCATDSPSIYWYNHPTTTGGSGNCGSSVGTWYGNGSIVSVVCAGTGPSYAYWQDGAAQTNANLVHSNIYYKLTTGRWVWAPAESDPVATGTDGNPGC